MSEHGIALEDGAESTERGTWASNLAVPLVGSDGVDGPLLVAYKEEEPTKAAFETALRLVLAAIHDEPFDVAAETGALLETADEYRLGPRTAAIVVDGRGVTRGRRDARAGTGARRRVERAHHAHPGRPIVHDAPAGRAGVRRQSAIAD